MESVLYSILSGAGAGGGVVFMFVLLQNQKIKEELRKEFYIKLEKIEHECNKYTDAKHDDVKEQLREIKEMLSKMQDILMQK